MSFILDALKKSEREHRQQTGPALLEMRVSAPRTGLPLWAILIAIALLANLGILAFLMLRGSGRDAATAPATQAAVAPATIASAAITATPGVTTPAPAANVLPDPGLRPPLPAAQSGPTVPPASAADYEPAVAPGQAPPSAATIAADMGLPTMQDLNTAGAGIPELRLSLHAYDPNPANRYVLLNSSRLREGEMTPEGVRLERVTEFGVVLSWRGRRFTLQRGE